MIHGNCVKLKVGSLAIAATLFLCACGQKEYSQSKQESKTQVAETVAVTHVKRELVRYQSKLPGELVAYRNVGLYPRVAGFVSWIGVDRGSVVKTGQLIIKMNAPELVAQKRQSSQSAGAVEMTQTEAERRYQAAKAQVLEARAKLESDETTYRRMKEAVEVYPGSVVQNEVDVAAKAYEAAKARLKALEELEKAAETEIRSAEKRALSAQDSALSAKQMEEYLNIYAPFDGVITERNVDEGSFVSAPTGTGTTSIPMVREQQLSVLRLVVAVPEEDLGGIIPGTVVSFTVPAFPDKTFSGKVKRIGHALDVKTRTMPVELDVYNVTGELEPGMYPEVSWPVERQQVSLVVPRTAVVTNTERRFVIRVKVGVTEWVDVRVGKALGDSVEIFGDLVAGDTIIVKASDQLENGKRVMTKLAATIENRQ
jgi:membrane fusion protein, multidrug efflux system